MADETIIVKYKTRKIYCSCCQQKLPESKLSYDDMEFEINFNDTLIYADWNGIIEFPEDMDDTISDFVYEMVYFYATNYGERITIEKSELDKVKSWILVSYSKDER